MNPDKLLLDLTKAKKMVIAKYPKARCKKLYASATYVITDFEYGKLGSGNSSTEAWMNAAERLVKW